MSKILTKQLLEKEYLINKKSTIKIGKKYNKPKITIWRYLKKYKIQIRTIKFQKERKSKICKKCNKLKTIKEFDKYKRKGRKEQYCRSYCITCIKDISKNQYNKNKVWWKMNYIKNKKKIDIYTSKFFTDKRKIWNVWLKKEYGYPVKCFLCKIKLYFGHKDKRKVPHFDHKRGKLEAIKYTPSSIFKLKMTKKRQELFKSCHFGILCDKCNKGLPTDLKTRRLILKNLIKYIGV